MKIILSLFVFLALGTAAIAQQQPDVCHDCFDDDEKEPSGREEREENRDKNFPLNLYTDCLRKNQIGPYAERDRKCKQLFLD